MKSPYVSSRSLFGFSRKPKRQPKPIAYGPGYEVMLELNDRLRKRTRTQPTEELAQAFVAFFRSKQSEEKSLEDIQAEIALVTYKHLQNTAADNGQETALSTQELRMALYTFKSIPEPFKMVNELARALFDELQKRQTTRAEERNLSEDLDKDLSAFIKVMAKTGDALYARDLIEQYWHRSSINTQTQRWSIVLRGFTREGNMAEVQKTLDMMQKYRIPFDDIMHRNITTYFALVKEDMELTKLWYQHPIANGRPPMAFTVLSVLRLCIKKNEMKWGESIFKSMLERSPDDLKSWSIILQWAAAKGRSVDEIEKMIEVMVNRSRERGTNLRPDIGIINGLIELANLKENPYTAERYLALSQKLGLEPDAGTFLLQLDYRLKVGDLGGAMAAYNRLRGEDVADTEDLSLINKLIVALAVDKHENYDAIMGLVEDLSERKARFEPKTVEALAQLHLKRGELDDLLDLLNTYAFNYGLDQRASIRDVLLTHCFDPSTPTTRAWDTYNILRQTFTETDIPTRTSLMTSFFERRRSDMATHVFGHMRQQQIKSLRPTVSIYAKCLSGLARAGDLQNLEIVHNMIKLDNEIEPDTQLYNALMLGYSGCGEPQHALKFWEDIVRSREGPSYASIQIALRACERAPFGEDVARDIWARVQRFDIEVTREIYAAYVGALAGQNLFDECVELIDNAEKEIGYQPDALLYGYPFIVSSSILIICRLGTFYNATPGPGKKSKVKEWAWKAYPVAYENLLKCGQYTIVRVNQDGEEEAFAPKNTLFDIGAIGRDVEA